MENSKTVRGHNIFDGLIYYLNGENISLRYNKDLKDEFIRNYMKNSEIENFGVIKYYLDDLFNK